MSRTTDYLLDLEERYARTYYPNDPNSYQRVLEALNRGTLTHAAMAAALRGGAQ